MTSKLDRLPLQGFYAHAQAALEADGRWLRLLHKVAVGESLPAPARGTAPGTDGSACGAASPRSDVSEASLLSVPYAGADDDDARCLNLGLLPQAPHSYRREVALDACAIGAVPVGAGSLQNIDTVSIISVQRPGTQYLYDTLKSMGQTFPIDTPFHVLVGNAQTDYVRPEVLNTALGTDLAQRVRVHSVPPDEAAFMAAHFTVHRRAAWNYARALLSYRGTCGLLVVEDDVQWARNAAEKLEWWLDGRHLPAISLYNRRGDPPPAHWKPRTRDSVVMFAERPAAPFECTQAMFFDPSITQALGEYMLLRLHQRPYDLLLGEFVRNHRLMLGYAYPSMVQHTGVSTTGLGAFHQSGCFVDPLP